MRKLIVTTVDGILEDIKPYSEEAWLEIAGRFGANENERTIRSVDMDGRLHVAQIRDDLEEAARGFFVDVHVSEDLTADPDCVEKLRRAVLESEEFADWHGSFDIDFDPNVSGSMSISIPRRDIEEENVPLYDKLGSMLSGCLKEGEIFIETANVDGRWLLEISPGKHWLNNSTWCYGERVCENEIKLAKERGFLPILGNQVKNVTEILAEAVGNAEIAEYGRRISDIVSKHGF